MIGFQIAPYTDSELNLDDLPQDFSSTWDQSRPHEGTNNVANEIQTRARVVIRARAADFNEAMPHPALGRETPMAFADTC